MMGWRFWMTNLNFQSLYSLETWHKPSGLSGLEQNRNKAGNMHRKTMRERIYYMLFVFQLQKPRWSKNRYFPLPFNQNVWIIQTIWFPFLSFLLTWSVDLWYWAGGVMERSSERDRRAGSSQVFHKKSWVFSRPDLPLVLKGSATLVCRTTCGAFLFLPSSVRSFHY